MTPRASRRDLAQALMPPTNEWWRHELSREGFPCELERVSITFRRYPRDADGKILPPKPRNMPPWRGGRVGGKRSRGEM